MPSPASNRIDQADIDRANAVSLADIVSERGLVLKKSGADRVGPCPHCGGTDRFSINLDVNSFQLPRLRLRRGRGDQLRAVARPSAFSARRSRP